MRHGLVCLGAVLLAGVGLSTAQQDKSKDNGQAPAAPTGVAASADAAKPASRTERKNPVKATPENLAAIKKFYGYDCAMCHGTTGDGKGDAAASMNLTLKDWRNTSTVADMSDADMFDVITKGKGKMVGEGDRLTPEKAWTMVHYVRSLAKKESGAEKEADKTATAATPKS